MINGVQFAPNSKASGHGFEGLDRLDLIVGHLRRHLMIMITMAEYRIGAKMDFTSLKTA